jgi:hypothetical protein
MRLPNGKRDLIDYASTCTLEIDITLKFQVPILRFTQARSIKESFSIIKAIILARSPASTQKKFLAKALN